MLLPLNSQIFCQSIVTKNTNLHCYNDAQISEMFKGLKQGDYLKVRLDKTEKALKDAGNVISSQQDAITKGQSIISEQKSLIDTNNYICAKDKEILGAEINQLNNTIQLNALEAKKDSRRKFWNGIKIGGVSVAIIGAGAFLLTR